MMCALQAGNFLDKIVTFCVGMGIGMGLPISLPFDLQLVYA